MPVMPSSALPSYLRDEISGDVCDTPRGGLTSLRFPGDVHGTYRHCPHLLVPGGDARVDDGYRRRGRGADGRGERPMTPIAPLITPFLREHMPRERGYSPHTCETYAHAFRLLFVFVSERLGKRPSQLCLEHI